MTAPRFERDAPARGPRVQGYKDGGFAVDGETYSSVLLTPEQASSWNPPPIADLGMADLAPLLALEPPPEFLLLGTGSVMTFPPRSLDAALDARGIGIETMDSRAAARTWGVLRAEERWIVAALMPL